MQTDVNKEKMQPFMSELTVLAFAVGTSLGWGSLVVSSRTYLKQAGPWGSALGLLIGGAVMLLVCRCYHYLANRYPEGTGTQFDSRLLEVFEKVRPKIEAYYADH